MDPGRYGLQQAWESNSALEGYGAAHEPDFRGSSLGGRRYLDDGFSRDPVYARSGFHREALERDMYPRPPPVGGAWPESRRRGCDDDYALRRHDKPYMGSFQEMDRYHALDSVQEADKYHDSYRTLDNYHDSDNYRDYGYDRHTRVGGRDRDDFSKENYDFRQRSREDSRERDYDYGRYSYDSDHDRSRREGSWRRRDSRDHERDKRALSRDRDASPYRRRDRSHSRGRDDRSRSRSPRSRSRGRSYREESYDDNRHERSERRREREHDERRQAESSLAPSATIVVKGLSQKTTEEDLYQILAEWGPLRHIRVIKERSSGLSRGFAFIDFPTVEAACNMMGKIAEDGLVIDGRKLLFEYSSRPTGGAGAPSFGHESNFRPGYGFGRSAAPPSDWMCIICGCVNFARRISCFQCNEPRTDDAPPADIGASNPSTLGRKGSDAGPTHVLVVRGLDENADEEMLRYEFSKHAPIKDLRLVRDKFTHVSRGFAFVHFYSVEDATKALAATNGTTLEKNGQVLRVAYAKSIHGPGAGPPNSSSLAAAAIEAAAFSQQYDAAGWAPKEYNSEEKQNDASVNQTGQSEVQNSCTAPQSGFIWDEKSGYYYDATSGFYYDGNTGLYYDGNSGIWYSYDHQSQQYVPCTDQNDDKSISEANETSKVADGTTNRKIVISAPATTTKPSEKASLADAVQAAAAAALAAERKEKEKAKEVKLASKSSLLANKKKMNNVLAMWKQRNHEGQAARIVLDDNQTLSGDDKQSNTYGSSSKNKLKPELKETLKTSSFSAASRAQTVNTDHQNSPNPVSNSSGSKLMGVIRGSGSAASKADATQSGSLSVETAVTSVHVAESSVASTPFKTDVSALGSYPPVSTSGSGKRRFSERPIQSTSQQPQTAYRDRAAERRSLYGSSSYADDLSGLGDSNRDFQIGRGSSSDMGTVMPFPPGVGGGKPVDDAESYEVITADRALDKSNVGNRMLRSMGWQEGLGLGRDGSGIKEPVQAKAVDDRAGLGSQQRRSTDPSLEAQAGDSYKTIIHKKAIARFREMQ